MKKAEEEISVVFTIRIPKSLYNKIREVAEKKGMKLSEASRYLLREGLKN